MRVPSLSRKITIVLLQVVLSLSLMGGAVFAGDPLGFSSSWEYQETGGDENETSQFNQNYNLTYNKSMSAAISFSGSVRYSESSPSEGAGNRTLSPNLALDLSNDLFSVNMNASETRSERDGAATRINDNWGMSLNSQIDQWPSLRLHFSQSTSSDDSQPKQADSTSQSAGASVEYEYSYFDMLYDVRQAKSEDSIQRSESESFDQTAKVSYSDTFWSGRVSVSASQQIHKTENSTDTQVGVGNIFDASLTTSDRLYYRDDNHLLLFPSEGTFQGVDLRSITEDKNMIIDLRHVNNDQPPVERVFNRVKVWLYREVGGERFPMLSSGTVDDSGYWLIYYREEVDAQWTQVALPAGSLTVTEDRLNGQLRTVVIIDLPRDYSLDEADFIKVVATDASIQEAYVDDIIAYRSFTSTSEIVSTTRDSTTLQTQFSSTIRFSDKWNLSYSLRRVEDQFDAGGTVKLSQSISSSYQLNDKVGFSFGVSESIDESDNSDDRTSRSYSIAMAAQPLPTMNFSVALTRSESSSDDGSETQSNALSTSVSAAIYPDLTARLSTSWTQSESQGSDNSSYGVTLNTTATLSPKTDMTTNLSYSSSDSSEGESSSSTRYGLSLGHRPSDVLALNASYSANVESGNSSLSGSSSWLWSRKLQSQLGFTYNLGDETSQQYNALTSWLISRSLSLQASGNFLVADGGNSWNVNSSLNLVY